MEEKREPVVIDVLIHRDRWIGVLTALPSIKYAKFVRGTVRTEFDEPGHGFGQWSAQLSWNREVNWDSPTWLFELSFLASPPKEALLIGSTLEFFSGSQHFGPMMVGTALDERKLTQESELTEIRGQINALNTARRLADEATAIVNNLAGVVSIINSLDYSKGDPQELEVMREQLQKLTEVNSAILELHLRKSPKWTQKT